MTGTADLDRTILAWLRDGDAVAPAYLAADVRRAIEAAPAPRRGLIRLWWALDRSRGLRTLVPVVAVGAVLAAALLGLLWATGSVAPPDATPTVGQTQAAVTSSASPTPSATVIPVVRPTEGPPPTYPPATTLSILGISFELQDGWWGPPSGTEMALIGALDRLGDPYAGVYNLLLSKGPRSPGGVYRFHSPSLGAGTDAGLQYWTSGIQEATPALEANRVQTVLQGAGNVVGRSSVKVPGGRAIALDWGVDVNGPDVHYRAYFFSVGGSVVRIDFATVGLPTPTLAASFVEIVRSARPEPPQ